MSRTRCINIDWLEVYVAERGDMDYSPEAFERRGFPVDVRDYGTKTMAQMFTILDNSYRGMIEVRRLPRGCEQGKKTVYAPGDSYLRLTNAYCYAENPVGILVDFMERNRYTLKRIYRIDICLDFVRFDDGDLPASVARRISNHTYAKMNQTERNAHGNDTWTECRDNSFHWGARGSMVSTKFYDKTLELKEHNYQKPWIVSQWLRYGLIDNPITISKDGKAVEVWRVEFTIKSSAREWVQIQKDESEDGCKHWLEHNLDLYSTKEGLWEAFRNLVPHYFHFKIYEEGKRKSRCKDKVLFYQDPQYTPYTFRLTNASDVDRVRPDVDTDLYGQIRMLSNLANRVTDAEAHDNVLRALRALEKKLNSQYRTEDLQRMLRESLQKNAASVDAARDCQPNTPSIF